MMRAESLALLDGRAIGIAHALVYCSLLASALEVRFDGELLAELAAIATRVDEETPEARELARAAFALVRAARAARERGLF